ncbi:MAG: hypothetical protein HUJ42_00095 [Malacoplasma sp.]|nr:hypothetical protein [Malacoplasma sp.]
MKIKINQHNTNWLSSLGITSIVCFSLAFLGFVVFIIDLIYASSNPNDPLFFQLLVFYYSVILTIIELVGCVYFFFNLVSWISSYKKSIGDRKAFNFKFVTIMGVLIILVSIDAIIRIVYAFFGLMTVGSYYGQTNASTGQVMNLAIIDLNQEGSIFGNTSNATNMLSIGNFGFNVILLMLFTLVSGSVSLYFYFKQNKLFVSEERENSKKEVKDNYRNLDMIKMKKHLSKHKQKDMSKRIKAF